MNTAEIQLARAFVCRKRQRWPIYPSSEWFDMLNDKYDIIPSVNHLFTIEAKNSLFIHAAENIKSDLAHVEYWLKEKFPGTIEILKEFKGKLVLAGGFITSPNQSRDVDLFFINCSPEEAEEIMIKASMIIYECKQKSQIGDEKFDNLYMSRTKNTTNISFMGRRYDILKYQFIHRIYPSIGHLLGGFDIQASMIAFDGETFLSTEAGAWAYINRTIVVDISRRSPSMGFRLMKYNNRGYKLVFPGCNMEDGYRDVTRIKERCTNFKERLTALLRDYEMCPSGPSYNYDYEYYTGNGGVLGYEPKDARRKFQIFADLEIRYKGDPVHKIQYQEKGDYIMLAGQHTEDAEVNYWASIASDSPKAFFTRPVLVNPETIRADFETHKFYAPCTNATIDKLMSRVPFYFTYRPDKWFPKDDPALSKYSDNMDLISSEYAYYRNPDDVPGEIVRLRDEFISDLLECIQSRQAIFEKDMKCVNWMTQDPQLQWTSTVHPEILKAQEYYKGKWNGCHVILHPQVETMLKLARKNPTNVWRHINKDIFNKIIMMIPYV